MTNPTCNRCGHDFDKGHDVLLMTSEPVPSGLVACATPGCRCSATWRASTGRSTPEEIQQTRIALRDLLLNQGLPPDDLPDCLL